MIQCIRSIINFLQISILHKLRYTGTSREIVHPKARKRDSQTGQLPPPNTHQSKIKQEQTKVSWEEHTEDPDPAIKVTPAKLLQVGCSHFLHL